MGESSDAFVRRQNIEKFSKQLGEVTDEGRRKVLQALLAAEIAKPVEAGKSHPPA